MAWTGIELFRLQDFWNSRLMATTFNLIWSNMSLLEYIFKNQWQILRYKTVTSPSGAVNIMVKVSLVNILIADHRRLEGMFERCLEARTRCDQDAMVDKIIKSLAVHTLIEEEHVFPLLKELNKDDALEAYEEHHAIKLLVDELNNCKCDHDTVHAKVKVLSEVMEHHHEEEEKKLFPMLQESDFDLFDIGREMLEHKNELERNVHEAVRKLHEEIAAGPCATTEKGKCKVA